MNQAKRLSLLKILSIFIALGIIAAAAVGYYLFSNLNFIIATFKPHIEKTASDALGAPVSLGEVQASVFPQPSLHVTEVAIGASADKTQKGLTLKDVLFQIEIMPLLSKRLEISTLRISNPHITFLRDAAGIAVAGLPSAAKKAAPPSPQPDSSAAENGAQPSANAQPLPIELKRLEVRNAAIVFDDKLTHKRYEIRELGFRSGVKIQGTSLDLSDPTVEGQVLLAEIPNKPLMLVVSAPLLQLSPQAVNANSFMVRIFDTAFTGSLTMDAKEKSGKLTFAGGPMELEKISILSLLLPQLSGLSGSFQPDLHVAFSHGQIVQGSGTIKLTDIGARSGDFIISKLSADAGIGAKQNGIYELSSNSTSLQLNGAPVKLDYALVFNESRDAAELKLKRLGIFGGLITSETTLYTKDQHAFSLVSNVKDVSIEQALQSLAPGAKAKLSGTVQSAAMDLKGVLGTNLMQSMNGTASAALTNGAIKDVNIAGVVLSALKNLPLITGELRGSVPPDKRPVFDDSDTAFDTLTGTFSIAQGKLSTNDLLLKSRSYDIHADGTVGIDSSVKLDATIKFSKEYSEALVAAAKDVRKILDKEGRLVVPVRISGTAPKLIVLPNFEDLLVQMAERGLKDKAGKVLDQLLGGGRSDGGKSKGIGDLLGF